MRGPQGLALGIVVAVYPEGNSIDVLMPKTGDKLANVQCSSITGSSDTGIMDLPEIGLPVDDTRWTLPIIAQAARYVRAIIWHVDGMPICMGFLLPQVTQMTFQRDNFRVNRHASDVYSTTNGQGDTEWYHPSGTYLRVGASPAHEDLTNQDVDQSWAIKQNTAAAPWVNLTVANAGAVVANIQVDPSGNINVTHNGNLTVNTKGNANVTVDGTTEVTSEGAVTVNASAGTTHNGPLTVNGLLTFTEGMNGSGGSGNTMSLTGNIGVTGAITSTGDQVAGGISQIGHSHTSESPGSPTSPPIAGT
ncbi:hypothetical protein PQR39_35750 [Paraburkholderia sediminicola]|uniref:hypothetical protein n=1 Tax=Paraburkholderia sediminicola TaxID=458836 RepID=UPI0038B84FD7